MCRIQELGLSVDFLARTEIQSSKIEDGRNIFQRLNAEGDILFLRYGPHETLVEFVRTPADLITKVTVIDDEVATCCEQPARRMRLAAARDSLRAYMFEGERPVHIDWPRERTAISVVGFMRDKVPVLVGYRIQEKNLREFQSDGDQFIRSVSCL